MDITIKSFINGEVSEQQVFDFVLAKLREQEGQSLLFSGPRCAYRGGLLRDGKLTPAGEQP